MSLSFQKALWYDSDRKFGFLGVYVFFFFFFFFLGGGGGGRHRVLSSCVYDHFGMPSSPIVLILCVLFYSGRID